jgi:hypothetical protein
MLRPEHVCAAHHRQASRAAREQARSGRREDTCTRGTAPKPMHQRTPSAGARAARERTKSLMIYVAQNVAALNPAVSKSGT